ncbi:uncharacterized protein LOC116250521 isoform X2 [Nymphaea colorata]|uniref:uncharacterized protein LOC116250521 isoform X2 n=1 Tax=Nymphaea colorata TaxID=210225 RepID=UPI00214EC563|nr:uncharacterized protein LOC116250521 isoform X2 [Nymphaea colorata]
MDSRRKVLHVLWCLFLGQVVSFLLTVGSFITSFLTDLDIDAPLTQAFLSYIILAIVFGCVLLYRRRRLKVSWYWYIFLGFVDVQGNYLVLKAYQYTVLQFIGAATCVLGLVLVLFSDAGVAGGGGTRPLLGDGLVIAGTIFYAISNVWEEFCVKKRDLIEVIGMLGIFGTLISGCEILIFEYAELESINWTPKVILLFAAFAVGFFLFYSTVPFILQTSGATMFNLSLLTSNMWAVLIRIFFYHQQVDWLYFCAFAVIAIGLAMYSFTGKDDSPATQMEGSETIQYHQLEEESNSNVVSVS